jgi:hypothetical protein
MEPMTETPLWFFDGQLSMDRQRMAQAHAVVTRIQDEMPPGYIEPGPMADRLHAARHQAYLAERQFAERFTELMTKQGDSDG